MTSQNLSEAKNPDIRNSLAAMQRAAEMARKIALQTNTPLVLVKDGKVVFVEPDRLDEIKSPASSGSGSD